MADNVDNVVHPRSLRYKVSSDAILLRFLPSENRFKQENILFLDTIYTLSCIRALLTLTVNYSMCCPLSGPIVYCMCQRNKTCIFRQLTSKEVTHYNCNRQLQCLEHRTSNVGFVFSGQWSRDKHNTEQVQYSGTRKGRYTQVELYGE